MSKLLTLCLTAVKKHWIRYYDTVYERDGINYFWSIKNSNDVLNKFKSKNFQVSKLPKYDFSTLYTTLPHHLIKDKLIDLINRTFIRENTQYLACNEECAFFTPDVYNNHNSWSCQKVCDALVYLLDNIFIRFGTKLYRQTIGIPMGTNCAPLVADLFLFCYERDFMKSISRENQADIIEAFNSTSRYLDDLLNIENIRFARASSNLNDFNHRNKALTAKLLRQGYRYFKLRKAFSKFYRRHSVLLEKYSVSLKTLMQQSISEPEFYGDLVYRFRKNVGKSNFSEQFRKLINRYKRIGYINPIIVESYASLFNCTTAVRASDSITASS